MLIISNPITALVTLLALFVYTLSMVNVSLARRKFKVEAPYTTGNADFERVFRVHQNNLEQLVLFLPSLWLFSFYLNEWWGAALGAIWVIARLIYMYGYYQKAERRLLGYAISTAAVSIMLLGSLTLAITVIFS